MSPQQKNKIAEYLKKTTSELKGLENTIISLDKGSNISKLISNSRFELIQAIYLLKKKNEK